MGLRLLTVITLLGVGVYGALAESPPVTTSTTEWPMSSNTTDGYMGNTTGYLHKALKVAVNQFVGSRERRNLCPRYMVFCVESHKCVPVQCKKKINDEAEVDIRHQLRNGIEQMVDRFMDKKDGKHHLCGRGMIFCVKRGTCVPMRCKDIDRSEGGIHHRLRNGIEQMVEGFLSKNGAKHDGCGHGMIFCVERHTCVPVHCKDVDRPEEGIRHHLTNGIKHMVERFLDKKDNKRHICGRGMIFCVKLRACVPVHCKDVNRPEEGIRHHLNNGIKQMVERFLDKKDKKHRTCGRGMIFCMDMQTCVPMKCISEDRFNDGGPKDGGPNDGGPNDGGPKAGDMSKALQRAVSLYRNMKSVCPKRMIFCMYRQACVIASCSVATNKHGECPVPKESKDGKCKAKRECESDSVGCYGMKKCCENECGGSTCSIPEFHVDKSDASVKAYKVVGYMASLNPDPIEIDGGRGIFKEEFNNGNGPKTLKFDLTSARTPKLITDEKFPAGCSWKKLAKEDVPLNNNEEGDEPVPQHEWELIEHNEIVDLEKTHFTCIPSDISFHGFSKVNVTDNNQNVHTLAVIILPANLPPTISLNEEASNDITFYEDVADEREIPVTVSNPMDPTAYGLEGADSIGLTTSRGGSDIYNSYTERLDKLNKKQNDDSATPMGVFVIVPTPFTTRVGDFSLRSPNGNDNNGNDNDNGNSNANGNSDNTNSNEESGSNARKEDGGWNLILQRDKGTAGEAYIKFKPELNYHGEFDIEVFGRDGGDLSGKKNGISDESIRFTIKILSVNDAPYLDAKAMVDLGVNSRSMWIELPVPLDMDSNTGVQVSDVVSKFFKDAEESAMGMCVIRAESSDIGSYELKLSGTDKWKKITVDDPADLFDGVFISFDPRKIVKEIGVSSMVEVISKIAEEEEEPDLEEYAVFAHKCLLLPSDAMVRFQPSNDYSDVFWPFKAETNWNFLAWDEAADGVNAAGDLVDITVPLCLHCTAADSVLSYAYLSGNAMRMGCNNKVSPVKIVNDICGECGGDGSTCTDCEGNKDGTAIWNVCGKCVLGNTGKEMAEGVDCRGSCSENQFQRFADVDNMCMSADTDIENFIDDIYCDGVWDSGAKIDKCNECAGGGNGPEPNANLDPCGVCFGDGHSCKDCSGDPNGKKIKDNCGGCRLRNDPLFNTGCQSIANFDPIMSLTGVRGTIEIDGAGLETLDSDPVVCYMTHLETGTKLDLEEVVFIRRINRIIAQYPVITKAGSYDISCDFIDTETKNKLILTVETETKFNAYGAPELYELTPHQAELGAIPEKIEVKGKGFMDTGEIFCYTNCPVKISRDCGHRDSIAVFEAEYVDANTVNCLIPDEVQTRVKLGFDANVAVSLSNPKYLSEESRAQVTPLEFSVIAPTPELLSAAFVGACKVVISFDDTISDVETCSDALEASSIAKLGDDPKCSVRGSSLIVELGISSTLVAGNTLTLKEQAIASRGSNLLDENTNHASGSTEVETTSVSSVKFEGFKAPPVIGNCDALTLKAKFQGAACSTLTYNWAVQLLEDNQDADILANLLSMQKKLELITTGLVDLTSDDMIPGQSYVFAVDVETHLGEKSPTKTATILRKEDSQPLRIDLGGNIEDWDVDRDLSLKVRSSKSDCVNFELTGIEYIWSAGDTVDFDLTGFNGVHIKIAGGTLKGDKEYTISLVATVADDTSISTTASVTIQTLSRDLIAEISRAPFIITGVGDSLDLDVSTSRDPDKAYAEFEYFTWLCEKLVTGSNEVLPCILPDGEGDFVQFEDSSIVADDKKKLITIPKNTLDSNSLYRFIMTYTKNERSATASIYVHVKEGRPPNVNIVKPSNGQHDPNKMLSVEAFVTSPLAVTASWSSISGEGYEVLDSEFFPRDTSFVEHDKAVKDLPVPLLIESGLKPGSVYKFRLDVAHTDSSSEAVVVINVNAPPQCTAITVEPTSGTELTDLFKFEAEGCDDEATDFPLKYQFFVVNTATGDHRTLSTGAQADSEFLAKLGEGAYTFGVEVCDQNRVCSTMQSEEEMTVSSIDYSPDDVSSILADIEEERALNGESSTAFAAVVSMLKKEGEVKAAGLAIAAAETNNVLSKANPAADVEGAVEYLKASIELTKMAKDTDMTQSMNEGASQQMKDTSAQAVIYLVDANAGQEEEVEEEVVEGVVEEGARRRKRAISQDTNINALEILTGESMILAQVSALEEEAEEDISKGDAVSFFNTLELVWQGVCAGLVNGQDADVGNTALVTFRAYASAFDGMANDTLYASCSNCTEVTNPATFQMGVHMQDSYSQWNCTDTDTCYGGCLATGQLNYDILTASSDAIEPLISTRYSDIVAVHLINPATYGYTQLSNLSSPISLMLPLTATPFYSSYQYMCRNWDSLTNDWSDSGCLPAVLDNSTDVWIATCHCFTTGYFAVFEGDEIISEVYTTTTEFSIYDETTTAANFLDDLPEDEVESVSVTFSIDANATILGNYSFVGMEVTSWLVEVLQIEEEMILNLVLSPGSIVVEFDLAPGGDTDLNTLLVRLETEVTSSAGITIGSTTYTCIPDSFGVTVNEIVTDPVITELNNGLKMGVIIGIVVGCSMLIILIVVIAAVIIIKKKAGGNKIQHSPRASQTHLANAELGTYDFKQTKASPAEEALYGPAPVPHRPSSVSKGGAVPIGSRPVTRDDKRSMTPIS